MTKKEFMGELRQALIKNKVNKVEEVLSDYEEHFAHALAEGKPEDEICRKLGTPETIAKAYETESMVTTIKDPEAPFKFRHALSVLGRLIVLAPFNFFVILIPGVIIGSLVLAGWSTVVGLASCSVAAVILGFQTDFVSLSAWLAVGAFAACLSLAAATVLGAILMFEVTKQLLILSISYLQWNVKFILER